MNDELLRLRALCMIQSADIASLCSLIKLLSENIRPLCPSLPDLDAEFLKQRKAYLQFDLEDLETKNPELAANIQKLIDQSCKNHPFDYE